MERSGLSPEPINNHQGGTVEISKETVVRINNSKYIRQVNTNYVTRNIPTMSKSGMTNYLLMPQQSVVNSRVELI